MNNWMKGIIAIICAIAVGSGYWYYLVMSYESDLGSNNTFVLDDHTSEISNSTNDSLLNIRFDSGSDRLEWAYTGITIDDGQNEYDCTLGGLSSTNQQSGKVQSNLNVDGLTFTIFVDATSESSFTQMSLPWMSESESSNFSLRFSKTDIYLGVNVSWMQIDGSNFNEITEMPDNNFSSDTSEKLDWYDYDLSTHRISPKDSVFLFTDEQTTYKVQFLNYYNEADESRYVTFIAARLAGEMIPAMNDPNLVQSSPCIISDDDNYWSNDEVIHLKENGIDICTTSCRLEIRVTYENVPLKGTEGITVE